MKIVLILAAANNDPLKKTDPFMPLSLPLIAGSSPNHDYVFVDMLAGENPDYNIQADIVGISARITAESKAYEIADNYRKKGITVVLGGAQISSVPHRAKEHADVVAVGEGEALWPIILEHYKSKELKDFYVCSPIAFDGKGKSVYQQNSYFDLKETPFALRNIYRKRYDFDTVFASRGCPIQCDFCSVPTIFGKTIRKRPINDVLEDIKSFRNFYYLLDDTVFGRVADYDYYIELYNSISLLPKKRYWTGQANLDAAAHPKGREVIKAAAKSGLLYAAIGIESINPEVLKNAGSINKVGAKTQDVLNEIKNNIRFIQEQGIVISGWFTVGYDEDSIDTFYQALEFCRETNIIPVISPIEALPGTKLYDEMMIKSRIDHTKTINIIHPHMKENEVVDAFREVNKKGSSLKDIIKRTLFYSKIFDNSTKNINEKIHNKIFKTIFTFVLQIKLRKGVVGFANTGSVSNLSKEKD